VVVVGGEVEQPQVLKDWMGWKVVVRRRREVN